MRDGQAESHEKQKNLYSWSLTLRQIRQVLDTKTRPWQFL